MNFWWVKISACFPPIDICINCCDAVVAVVVAVVVLVVVVVAIVVAVVVAIIVDAAKCSLIQLRTFNDAADRKSKETQIFL